MPVVGVLFLQWTVFSVLLLYWCENVIVGGFNVLRMLTADPGDGAAWIGKVFLIPFFCFHYGLFTFVHGQFVLALFGGAGMRHSSFSAGGLIAAVEHAGIRVGVVVLLVSHAVSFVYNYLMSGENRRASLPLLMAQPYARVMILHVTILVGGFLVQLAGAPILAILLLVILKTAIDLRAHLAERAKLAPAPA
jgi:hypothetical protein